MSWLLWSWCPLINKRTYQHLLLQDTAPGGSPVLHSPQSARMSWTDSADLQTISPHLIQCSEHQTSVICSHLYLAHQARAGGAVDCTAWCPRCWEPLCLWAELGASLCDVAPLMQLGSDVTPNTFASSFYSCVTKVFNSFPLKSIQMFFNVLTFEVFCVFR